MEFIFGYWFVELRRWFGSVVRDLRLVGVDVDEMTFIVVRFGGYISGG